ncbi:MAG: DUF1553 domain-containing protein, partial [Limisphaerales bacterium]
MSASLRRFPWRLGPLGWAAGLALLWFFIPPSPAATNEAVFIRGINLNGPPVTIDGRAWDGIEAGTSRYSTTGKSFENPNVPLKPPTDPQRARMIRSSVWGAKVDVTLGEIPDGWHQVILYVWEDNHSEQFDLLVNDQPVLENFHSGAAGTWKKLGPWRAQSQDGRIRISARGASHGAANLSGVEIWSGDGTIPAPRQHGFADSPTPEQIAFFESKVRPVLVEHCYECHSATGKKLKGGLVLDSRAGIRKGGDTGPAITPGAPEASLLIQAIRHTDASLAMPPDGKLDPRIIADLEAWVRLGAPDPRSRDTVAEALARSTIQWDKAGDWWAFRPLREPSPPGSSETPVPDAWPVNDLDRFILARLDAEGLRPAPDASPATLIRRVTFDLTGLPPRPEDIDAFTAHPTSAAFAEVVERLLNSPAYGERWGRHWLDVVRYADTAGDNSDFPIPQMRRYRDWVIEAFNRDLPYDEFVREQLAGDLLPPDPARPPNQRLIATGYIANARRFGSRVDDYPQHLTIEDTLDNLGRAFLGLSLSCARCHDHKFDPISAADYYALYGIFQSTRYPWPGIELDQKQRDLVPLVDPSALADAEATRKTHDRRKAELEKALRKLKDSLKDTPADQKEPVEKRIKDAEKHLKDFVAAGLPFELAYAVADAPKAQDAAIQLKGDPAKPGPVVPRRFLTVLGGTELPDGTTGSGRRELAEWIVDPANPLTARVMVNRIWLQHFGKGLVPTPNDFGRQGKPPTHPELLDWLASRFIASGWSVKAMHRLILQSRTYRLASSRSEPESESAASRDPNNDLLSSFPRRRLDAEALRDALLVLGGNLDRSQPGPHPFPAESEWKFTQHNPFRAVYESNHRSVYLMTQRIQRHPFLALFDGADPSASTATRLTSTTPLQALFLLNDPFVHRQSREFALRILGARSTDSQRLGYAFQAAIGRPPDARERENARRFLQQARALQGASQPNPTTTAP